jgi:hypothetical protein
MTGGALVGISAALATALLLRLQLPGTTEPVPVAAAVSTPIAAPTPPSVAAQPATISPATAPVAILPKARPAIAPVPRPDRRVEPARPMAGSPKEEPAAVAQKTAARRERTPESEPLADRAPASKSLFGGVD